MRTKLPDLGRQQKNADLPPPPKIKVYLTFPQNCFFFFSPYDMSNKVPHVTLNLSQGCQGRGAPGRFQKKEIKENPTQGLVFLPVFFCAMSQNSQT